MDLEHLTVEEAIHSLFSGNQATPIREYLVELSTHFFQVFNDTDKSFKMALVIIKPQMHNDDFSLRSEAEKAYIDFKKIIEEKK